ncbi:MAG: SemiSWEET transporter [Candidatus Woesearchaeota archaeon]|jgi:MtN3 and saliva related transmembrane protein|nr:SemiSWEET transporter [Candidatus Woesearchaeota archaeon]MDP7622954.1 SemiSWEET transporter [Candidatus Woesearchaeota archaeon]HJN57107.1 SemiSWEET transporter [Candidatus Woesearchaeota archaeon]|tara:strand:- start:5079 stop:5333 length:255 start_codon:yes stop_codon:yes gene_type:complete
MSYIETIGFTAAALTTIAFLPQVIKAWKSKHTKDISLIMFIVLTIGIFLWVVYGFLILSMPVIAANVVTFVLALTILILKLKYK